MATPTGSPHRLLALRHAKSSRNNAPLAAPDRGPGHAGLRRPLEGPRRQTRQPGGVHRARRPGVTRRPGPAGAAVLLLATLFLAVAWTASSSSSPPPGLSVTPEVLARYAPP